MLQAPQLLPPLLLVLLLSSSKWLNQTKAAYSRKHRCKPLVSHEHKTLEPLHCPDLH
jgi:hypothetical protein